MSGSVHTVLLVDDDNDNNTITSYMINKNKLAEKIYTASNGQEAIEFLKNNPPPDLILLDLHMPLMNGWEFLEEYKNIDSKKKQSIVILMVTSSLNPDDKERAKKYEVGFVNKPLSINTLKEVIERKKNV